MRNLNDIARIIAFQNGMSTRKASMVIKSVFNAIENSLVEDKEEVRIKNFGTFKFGVVPGRVTKHPVTKEVIEIPERETIRLGLSTKLKGRLQHE